MLSKKHKRRDVCTLEVKEVIIPLSNWEIHGSRYKDNAPSRDFVRFKVYEEQKSRSQRNKGDRILFINDHREATFRAARSFNMGTRLLPGRGRVLAKTMSLPGAVRLPARVAVVEVTNDRGTVTFVNLYQPESKKASGLFVVLSELLIKEKLFLDKIAKYEPRWWWGGRKNTSFGPSGDTLPVVALTDGSRKIIFHCRKSGDVVTLGSEVKTVSTLSL